MRGMIISFFCKSKSATTHFLGDNLCFSYFQHRPLSRAQPRVPLFESATITFHCLEPFCLSQSGACSFHLSQPDTLTFSSFQHRPVSRTVRNPPAQSQPARHLLLWYLTQSPHPPVRYASSSLPPSSDPSPSATRPLETSRDPLQRAERGYLYAQNRVHHNG